MMIFNYFRLSSALLPLNHNKMNRLNTRMCLRIPLQSLLPGKSV